MGDGKGVGVFPFFQVVPFIRGDDFLFFQEVYGIFGEKFRAFRKSGQREVFFLDSSASE
jgi:hypothetical protein